MAKADGAKPRPKPTGKKSSAAKDEKSQRERFIETAQAIGACEESDPFEESFWRIVPPKRVK